MRHLHARVEHAERLEELFVLYNDVRSVPTRDPLGQDVPESRLVVCRSVRKVLDSLTGRRKCSIAGCDVAVEVARGIVFPVALAELIPIEALAVGVHRDYTGTYGCFLHTSLYLMTPPGYLTTTGGWK